MKKAPRAVSGIAVTAAIAACGSLLAAPASAIALFSAAAGVLSATPGVETLVMGMIGLGCLGIARHRASV